MELSNGKYSLNLALVEPFLQRHFEAFFRTKREIDGSNQVVLSSPERNGNVVRAAIRAKILTGLEIKAVDDLEPGAVRWIARGIDSFIAERSKIDPE